MKTITSYLILSFLLLGISSCNQINNDSKSTTLEKEPIQKLSSESLTEEIKGLTSKFEGKSIGIDPLVINWESLPELSNELKKKLKFDISDGNPIKLHSYISVNQDSLYLITVHQFVDMDQGYFVGKLTTINQNNVIGSNTVASFIDIYSQHIIASFFESNEKLRIEETIYPEPPEVAELNHTKDSLLISIPPVHYMLFLKFWG